MKPRIDDPQDATDDESSGFDDIEHVEPLQNSTIKQLKCEVKEYEERMNLKGESVMKEIEERHAVDEKVEGQDYAMKSYKRFSRDGELESSRLEIQSPYLKDTLRTAIEHYPGVSLRGDTIILHGPLRCIFHYRKELEGYRQKVGDRYAKLHIHLLLRFMGKELRSSIRGYEANVGASISNPAIEYKDLWMVFLPVIQRLRQRHIARGRKFCALKGHHHRSYTGRAFAVSDKWDEREDDLPRPPLPPGAPYSKYKVDSVTVNSRIVVDCKTFGESKSPNRVWLNDRKPLWTKPDEEEINTLSDDDLMICDFQIPGFSLFDKKWCFFAVDFIKDVEFNDTAFQQLLLPKNHKNLVHALVKNHGSDDFDDLIKGKGKGLVFVLHGAPGVGKTFTAESIADDVGKPLYVVNSGELGVRPYEVEMHLNSALRLATHWGAIVLIDEADVFLEQRTIHDLTRNCLVSLFLRILEYYEGILFLTTNRLTSFDLAFKSRIHLALKYTPLDHHRRKELWKLFIGRSTKETSQVWDEAILDDLARVDINGRQIKNSVRTASTLARSMNTVLAKEHIDIVLGTIESFEADLNEDTQDVVA
ncbi:hypothetical protein IFR04_010873 [Cadophora malorum]|uniref:AAA+ ATPase domain-containing protein n=1 Tax=Cadophora malorum TaxID=108018 RepID=A0A8H7TBV3_9HELO|nr:hypothetical protein IFR04_010873 [Cadophora malorum]